MPSKKDKSMSDEEREAVVYAINKLVDATGDLSEGLKSLTDVFNKCCAHRGGGYTKKPIRYTLKRVS